MRTLFNHIILLVPFLCSTHLLSAQLASPVIDPTNNVTGAIIKAVEKASKVIREDILPFKESISKIQTFFKKSKTVVNVVVKNLRLVHQLVKQEQKIEELLATGTQSIENAENLPNKWMHYQAFIRIWYESRNILQIFDLAYLKDQSIMDDKQRILIFKETLNRLRKVYVAMRIQLRRTQKEIFRLEQSKRRIQAFDDFFKAL